MSDAALFHNPLQSLSLKRWPRRRGERLRAWDGADLLLLEYAADLDVDTVFAVINDQCGAIALPLLAGARQLSGIGDSWQAHQALVANARDNQLDIAQSQWHWRVAELEAAPTQILMRVPKSLALFESQLELLAARLPIGAVVTVAAMDKHAPPTLVQLLEKVIGPVSRARGQHKAHLYHACLSARREPSTRWPTCIDVPELGASLSVDAGVFSQTQLDPGARFLLGHLPEIGPGAAVDLGCGNGVLGLTLARRNPDVHVWFCDESAAAVASAQRNAETLGVSARSHFHHGNGLDGLTHEFDLILLNPPFHRGHAVDTGVAEMLFDHARRHLRQGGKLLVIGNRHLNYAISLRKRFGRVEQLAANSRFTIWQAI